MLKLRKFYDASDDNQGGQGADPDTSQTGGSDNQGGEAKYTQAEVNKMIAASVNQATDKVSKEFQAKLDDQKSQFDATKDDLIEQGKQLAGESATEEAERKAKAREERLDRREKEADARDAAQRRLQA